MNEFKFTKAITNNKEATILNNFNRMTDVNRIERIQENMKSIGQTKQEKNVTQEPKLTNDIYRNRINALNNIKKD